MRDKTNAELDSDAIRLFSPDMQSRLHISHPELNTELRSKAFDEAYIDVLRNIESVHPDLSTEVLKLLQIEGSIADYSPSSDQIRALDERYFDLEKRGKLNLSKNYFCAARFSAACKYLQSAATFDDPCNAVYEAQHSRV